MTGAEFYFLFIFPQTGRAVHFGGPFTCIEDSGPSLGSASTAAQLERWQSDKHVRLAREDGR